jgi:hypothetical protein
MCNCENNLKCITKYKANLNLYDKIIMGLVMSIVIVCLCLLVYGVFNPIYLMC